MCSTEIIRDSFYITTVRCSRWRVIISEAVTVATVVTAAAAMGQEAPKVDKLTTETTKTISHKAPISVIEAVQMDGTATTIDSSKVGGIETVKTNQEKLKEAQLNLAKTQLEFTTAHAALLEKFKHDGFTTEKLNEIADYSQKLSVFLKGFLNGKEITPENIQTIIQKALEFSKDSKANTGKESKILEEIATGVMGGLVTQAGMDGTVDANGNAMVQAGTVASKDQTTRAFWVGENNNNIIDRLVAAEVKVYMEKAQLEKQNVAMNNIDNLASR